MGLDGCHEHNVFPVENLERCDERLAQIKSEGLTQAHYRSNSRGYRELLGAAGRIDGHQ